jgi:hypothetical protein
MNDMVLLCSIADDVNSGIVIAALKDNNIPVVLKKRGMGEYLTIYMGISSYGVDIYVAPEHEEKARELLSKIILDEAEINEETDEETDEEFNAEITRSKRNKYIKGQILFWFFFGLPILAIITILIYFNFIS